MEIFSCVNLFERLKQVYVYLVACRLELPSSMSGSGEGFGDLDECDKGASSLLISGFD